MKQYFNLIVLLFLSCYAYSQGKVVPLPSAAPASGKQILQDGNPGPAAAIRIRCSRNIDSDNTPLFVVDGMLYEPSNVSHIKPADIIEIQILKTSLAEEIYGCRALHGVIIITTKKTYHRKFTIRDANTLFAVSNATVEAKSVKTGKVSYFVADAYGRFETDSLRPNDYDITISSTGYKTSKLSLKSIVQNNREVKLETAAGRLEVNFEANNLIYVYPNPVATSGTINISFPNVLPGFYQLRLLSAAGQLLYSFQKQITGNGQTEQIHLNGKTLPGMYIIQVIDQQKKLIQSNKIVVQ